MENKGDCGYCYEVHFINTVLVHILFTMTPVHCAIVPNVYLFNNNKDLNLFKDSFFYHYYNLIHYICNV